MLWRGGLTGCDMLMQWFIAQYMKGLYLMQWLSSEIKLRNTAAQVATI